MAIGFNLTNTEFGIDFPSAYGRIVRTEMSRQNGGTYLVSIDLSVYATQAGADLPNPKEIDFKRYHFPFDPLFSGDILATCYTFIMAQPEFAGAVAV